MSAFVCHPDHFKALAVFAVRRDRYSARNADPRYIDGLKQLELYDDRKLACAYADALYAWNMVSVLHRYPDDTEETAPGPGEKPERINISARDMAADKYRLEPVALLKMCDCLEYQSSEREGWTETAAYRLLNAIRRAAIHLLPGYADAPWDFHA